MSKKQADKKNSVEKCKPSTEIKIGETELELNINNNDLRSFLQK